MAALPPHDSESQSKLGGSSDGDALDGDHGWGYGSALMVSAPNVRLLLRLLFDEFFADCVELPSSFSFEFIKGPAGVLVTSFEPYNCTA